MITNRPLLRRVRQLLLLLFCCLVGRCCCRVVHSRRQQSVERSSRGTIISQKAAAFEVEGQQQPPVPTQKQLRFMDTGLAMFIHFSVNPFTSIEHNCVGASPDCIPASKFNPTNLSTDQVRSLHNNRRHNSKRASPLHPSLCLMI